MADATESRKRAWRGADRRHDMSLSPEVRNSRENELLDHYSVGADLGPIGAAILGAGHEFVGRPLLARFPDAANAIAPSVFNFKTPTNNRVGSIDPYTDPTLTESVDNLRSTLSGGLDNYPKIQSALGLTQGETVDSGVDSKLLLAIQKLFGG